MNAYELVKFLGYSSIHPPLEDCLDSLNVKWRPRITKSRLDTLFLIKDIGASISFGIDAEDDGVIVKSEGEFILESVEVKLISDEYSVYKDFLPYALQAGDSREVVRQKLGAPRRVNEDSDNYFIDGAVWIVAYKEEALEFIQFVVPDDGWRKRGLCD
ncbi:hypothetical protein ACFX58_10795 [Sphingomonas sp. NCPPB 2930]